MNKIFHHPIWSKVIAGIILMIIGWLVTVFQNIDWQQFQFLDFRFYLEEIPITTILLVLSVIFLALAIIDLAKNLITYAKKKIENRKTKKKDENNTTLDSQDFYSGNKTTEFFSHRVGDAFPGLRGFKWINNSKVAIERLEMILRNPLQLKIVPDEDYSSKITPIWWFSKGGSFEIKSFKVLQYPMLFGLIKGKVLIGWNEYIIKRIGVFHSPGRYYLDMVYIETLPDRRTGLYKKIKGIKEIGRVTEEYALFKGKKITREEYDDGSAIIKGKPVNCHGAELRVRNLAKSNFIICAKFSPYNSQEFDFLSMDEFDKILKGEIEFEEVFAEMKKMPRIDNSLKF